jgi:hypothetical protein
VREVKLVMKRASFFVRLRVQLWALRRVFAVLVATGLLLPAAFQFLLMLTENDELLGLERAELFAVTATANVGLFVAIGLFTAFVRSIVPSPVESLLPRAVTFRVDRLWVEPRDGDAYEASWAWISRAVKTAYGMDLKIGHTPTLIVHVTPAMIGPQHFEQILIWLERHGKIA